MIHVFFGTDIIAARTGAQEYLEKEKGSGAEVIHLTGENGTVADIEQAIGSTSLFGGREVFLIDTPSENIELFEYVFKNIKEMQESPNTFIMIEGDLKAPEKKKIQKYAESETEYVKEKEKPFNIFGLADALLRRDKKSLWILITEARNNGLVPEEIIGTLFWQVKTLALASKTKSPEEAGVSAFPYKKAKQALSQFTEDEIQNMLESLTDLYHKGHSGERDIDAALEAWVLTH